MIKAGDRVRLNDACKARLRGPCGPAGKHLNEVELTLGDPESATCMACSSDHVEEFGESVGVVTGPVDFNNKGEIHDPNKIGPELNVVWEPDNLRYGYHPDDLELAP